MLHKVYMNQTSLSSRKTWLHAISILCKRVATGNGAKGKHGQVVALPENPWHVRRPLARPDIL